MSTTRSACRLVSSQLPKPGREVSQRDSNEITLFLSLQQAKLDMNLRRTHTRETAAAKSAAEGDFVVVTNNASDFRRLYATQPLHSGFVIIIPSVNRVGQQRLAWMPRFSS